MSLLMPIITTPPGNRRPIMESDSRRATAGENAENPDRRLR
jgi:hypothetical protein